MPLVDYVHVGNLKLEEAQARIEKRLADSPTQAKLNIRVASFVTRRIGTDWTGTRQSALTTLAMGRPQTAGIPQSQALILTSLDDANHLRNEPIF